MTEKTKAHSKRAAQAKEGACSQHTTPHTHAYQTLSPSTSSQKTMPRHNGKSWARPTSTHTLTTCPSTLSLTSIAPRAQTWERRRDCWERKHTTLMQHCTQLNQKTTSGGSCLHPQCV